MNDIEEMLTLLKKHNVKVADWANGQLYRVEFFPDVTSDALEKKPREDEKVSEVTGLTRSRSQDMFLMDE